MRRYFIGTLLFLTIFLLSLEASSKTENFYFLGIPKSGTHLLIKIIYQLDGDSFDHGNLYPHPDNFKRDYSFIKRNKDKKFVLIVRDPRDTILSGYEFVANGPIEHDKNPNEWDYWHLPLRNNPDYLTMTDCERMSEMVKMSPSNLLIGSSKIYTGYLVANAVKNFHNVMIVRFEDLVGSKGGGNDEVALQQIAELAEFLDLPQENVEYAFINSWGPKDQHGYKTFRHGVIGRWKTKFDEQVIHDFKTYGRWNEFILEFGYEEDKNW
ncbi:MAG: sulfotransferase domain-containing protein [Chlamydiales bacterium]